jgi:hypothetical protein
MDLPVWLKMLFLVLSLALGIWYVVASHIEMDDPERYRPIPRTRRQWLVRLGRTQAPSTAALLIVLTMISHGWEVAAASAVVWTLIFHTIVDRRRYRRILERLVKDSRNTRLI